MSPPRLSALIVARNEEARLPDCLASVAFADEVVVVLDRSTDSSASIAAFAGAKIVEGSWELEGDRRNAGLDACSGDWILEVDADERVNAELAEAGLSARVVEVAEDKKRGLVARLAPKQDEAGVQALMGKFTTQWDWKA